LDLIVTIFLLPETKGKSLEELSEEPSAPLGKPPLRETLIKFSLSTASIG
jgi:hypothetical protein